MSYEPELAVTLLAARGVRSPRLCRIIPQKGLPNLRRGYKQLLATEICLRLGLFATYFDFHAEERGAECLTLGVGAERDGPAAAQSLMEQKIQRSEVRQLETLDRSLDQIAEVLLDALGGDFAHQGRIVAGIIGDHANVAGIAFVPGTSVCDTGKRNFHGTRRLLYTRIDKEKFCHIRVGRVV